MNEHDLKELAAMGAELGAAKAEIQTLRTALLAIDQRNDNPARFDQEIDKIVRAALSRQAEPQQSREAEGLLPEWWMEQHTEPSDTFTAVDMATAAAQGFRDGQAAVEQAPAQDEREAFEAWVRSENAAGCVADMQRGWMARATRPAQTEQQPAFPVDSEAWLQEWARGKFTYTGAYKPRVLGQLYGNTDWALARALHSAIVSQLHAPIAQTAPQPEQSELIKALEEIAAGEKTVWRDDHFEVENDMAIDYPGIAKAALDAYRSALSAQGAGDADS